MILNSLPVKSGRVRAGQWLCSLNCRFVSRALLLCLLALPVLASVPPADAGRYLADVKLLAAPSMEGRGAGTKGLRRAGRYLKQQFRSLGLQPGGLQPGAGSSYFQPFAVTTGARLRGKNSLSVRNEGSEKHLELNSDYIPLSFSSVGAFAGPVVFAGYGISAPEFQYDDYAHLDVKDKIVLLLRYEPERFGEKNGGHGTTTQHAHLITKAINARNHGAKAVILVNGKIPQGEEDLLLRFGTLAGPQDAGILLIQAKNSVVDVWLRSAGTSLQDLQRRIDADLDPHSVTLPESLRISLAVGIQSETANVNNVIGYLPGKSDQYIIIGAHYDHLGRGNASSLAPSQIGQWHLGADDNASGTAGLLELARAFSRSGERLDRGILFIAFAGEELGLLGSSDWIQHPTLPLDKAVAMINMDMIGRIKDSKVYVGGVGTGSTFKPLLEKLGTQYGFKLEYSAGGYSASDHTSFLPKRIPVLFFFSGLHSDYHKPSDTWDKISPKPATQLLNLVADVVSNLVSSPERPQFVQVESEMVAGGRSGGGRGYGPYFGSIPDFGQVENGVKFADVRPGSPAARAGLRPGDVLVQFGDKLIKNLYDFTDALRRSKVGEVVEVKVLREGKPVTARVTLEQRR
jgi:hypothetical protein